MAKKKKPQEEKKKEKIFTISLADAYRISGKKRARGAVIIIKNFLKKNLKADVKFTKELNESLWARGMGKPPRRIRVKVTEEEGTLVASTVG